MFRRSKPATSPSTSGQTLKGGVKGRPTPSRREAEAAARARAKAPRDKKQASRASRAQRTQQNAKIREGMKTGDERYLPTRDKGPVRRFVRDFVDARLCMAELLLPALILIMITSSFDRSLSNALWSTSILLVGLDTVLLVFKLRRALRLRFPDQSTKGATGYAILRALQLRWIRLPKTKVKLGGKLPERY